MKIPKKGAIALLVVGAIGGLVFSGAFASFVQYSNTMEFCISCHEMRSTVYQELKESKHYKNPMGVRAKCSDCHVPHTSWIATVGRKIVATRELYFHLVGAVDTKEKFEAKRLELAQEVWAEMKASDSETCRSCHKWDAMDLAAQRTSARVQHESAIKEGKTCIDCHKGLVHKDVSKELEKEKAGPGNFTL